MQYSVLGPLEVRDGERRLAIPGRKERALLGLLIVEAGTVVSTDRMIYELWSDDPPATAKRTLRSHISRARSALAPDAPLRTQQPGYVLDVASTDIDSAVFESLAEQARYQLRSDPRSAARTSIEALGLWRGEALADLIGFAFAESEARRLEELRLSVLGVHLDAEVHRGRHLEVIHELQAAVVKHPFYERFWALLMLALYRAGRAGDALRTYEDARRELDETLGIQPSTDLRMLERAIVLEDPSLEIETAMSPHNLPSMQTSFVGRDHEITALGDVLSRSRLVTLTGAGGSGKSRLAIEAASHLLPRFPDGIWRAELATVRDPAAVPVVVTAALGDPASHAADPTESLVAYLAHHTALLVIDNCEHLLDGCAPFVTTVLSRCPRVRILATSREPLRVAGESIVMVPPLGLPDPADPPDLQEQAEAFRLFVERSQEASGNAIIDDEERAAITAVCRSLAGLPLAIELAAARTRTLDPKQLQERIGTGLDVLTGAPRTALDRHRTMRAAIDWSHRLLTPDEQTIFRRLAVFRGGWTLEAAERIIGADDTIDVEDTIARLVDRSLVERSRTGEPRYRLLEPIREFARERFTTSEERLDVRRRHIAWYLDLARRGDDGTRGSEQQMWWRRLDNDHDNIRSALRWSLDEGHVADALRLVAAMGWYWFTRGYWRESWIWFEEAHRAAGAAFPAERAGAAYKTASLEIIRLNHEPALTVMRGALEDCIRLGDRTGTAWCLHFVGLGELQMGLGNQGDYHTDPLFEAHRMFEDLGDPWAVAWSTRYVGDLVADRGDVETGIDYYLRSVAGFTDLGDRWSIAHSLDNLAKLIAYLADPQNLERARGYFRRSLQKAQEIEDPVWTAHGLLGVGWGAHRAGEPGAIALLSDAQGRLRLIGDEGCLANASAWLAEESEQAGDTTTAAAYLREAILLARKLSQETKIALNLDRAARLAWHHGEGKDAARLAGVVERAVRAGSIAIGVMYLEDHKAIVDLVGALPDEDLDVVDAVPVAIDLLDRLATAEAPIPSG